MLDAELVASTVVKSVLAFDGKGESMDFWSLLNQMQTGGSKDATALIMLDAEHDAHRMRMWATDQLPFDPAERADLRARLEAKLSRLRAHKFDPQTLEF
jgi:hypothetical protein